MLLRVRTRALRYTAHVNIRTARQKEGCLDRQYFGLWLRFEVPDSSEVRGSSCFQHPGGRI